MRTFENYLVFIICALGMILDACSGYETNKFLNDMLDLHNTTRALHDAGQLEWDHEMSIDAMKCLKAMYFDEFPSDGKPVCNEKYQYTFYESEPGEEVTATKIFFNWYNQGKDYNYTIDPTMNDQINESYKKTQFIQIVWKSTTTLGLAAVEKEDKFFVVATYRPPGNIPGKFLENVSRPNIETSSSNRQ